jgi:hypothetical protein
MAVISSTVICLVISWSKQDILEVCNFWSQLMTGPIILRMHQIRSSLFITELASKQDKQTLEEERDFCQ